MTKLPYEFKPDEYSSHMKILKLVRGANLKILDVGCATGYLAKELQKKGHTVYGIEANAEAAKEAKKYCNKVLVGDIETIKISFNERFDVIIMGDFLAHLKNPEKILEKLGLFLKEDGYIIASTGNIANIHTRLMLLFGKFDYVERGILDKTHLRFFTLNAFCRLIENAGFYIAVIDSTPIPLPLVYPKTRAGEPFNFVHKANYFLSQVWKKLFGYQFIIVARIKIKKH